MFTQLENVGVRILVSIHLTSELLQCPPNPRELVGKVGSQRLWAC